MSHHSHPGQIEALAYGALDPEEKAGLAEHVRHCSPCSEFARLCESERHLLKLALAPRPYSASLEWRRSSRRHPSLRYRSSPVLAGVAAAVFVMLVLWMLKTPPHAEAPASEPRWLLPSEVASVPAMESHPEVARPKGIFRTAKGRLAVLYGKTLYYSEGGSSPWRTLPIPFLTFRPECSDAIVEGESLGILEKEDGRAAYVAIELTGVRQTTRFMLPGSGFTIRSLELASSGRNRYAVIGSPKRGGPGALAFSRSSDEGQTWTPFAEVASDALLHGQHGLVATGGGLHLFYAGFNGAIGYLRSFDEGTTWESGSVSLARSAPHKAVDYVRSAATSDGLQLVYAVQSGELFHLSSSDGGRSWGAASRIATAFQVQPATVHAFRFVAAGSSLVITAVQKERQSETYSSRTLVSRDGGQSWQEEEAARAGLSQAPAGSIAWADPQGQILLLLEAKAPTTPNTFLLVREFGTPSEPRTNNDGSRACELIKRLDSEDARDRENATRQLREMGVGAVPWLRQAATATPSAEAKYRILDLLREIELAWPDPARVPGWWKQPAGGRR